MTTVAINPTQAISQATSPMKTIADFFINYWGYLLSVIIIAVVIGIAYAFYMILKKERSERDSEAFANYNTTVSDCKMNSDKTWIKNKYSFLNLLWFGIPFKWSEHSARLLDVDRKLLGYYRGHFEAQDGTINYLVYKTKSFIFFEDLFIIKVPKRVLIPCGPIKKHTKSNKENKTKMKEIDFKLFIKKDQWNNDIHFQAVGMQKISLFYRTPNFIYNGDRDIIDLRKHMLGTINDDTWKLGYERMVNLNARMMRKAIDGNPYVQTRKQGGEIEQETQEIEKEEEYK